MREGLPRGSGNRGCRWGEWRTRGPADQAQHSFQVDARGEKVFQKGSPVGGEGPPAGEPDSFNHEVWLN